MPQGSGLPTVSTPGVGRFPPRHYVEVRVRPNSLSSINDLIESRLVWGFVFI